MLHEQHARDQDTGIAHDQTAGLKNQTAIQIAGGALDHIGIRVRYWWWFVVVAVRNAQATAEIDMGNNVAVATQRAHELGQQRKSVAERIEVDDLAADMHVDAGDLDTGELRRMRIDVARAADRNAELVLGLAGGNLVMGLGVDVRIDADRNMRAAAL